MMNATLNHTEEHHITEGGFLSGRNPFLFSPTNPLPTFIIQLLIILGMSRLVKLIISPIKQPSVIAETISGIILGPTVMGHIPNFTDTIFSKPSLPFLNLMAHFGLVLFLFLVGLELDPRLLKSRLKNSLAISATGISLSFSLGVGVAYLLYHNVEPPSYQNGFTRYVLFLGVSMSITALPVLARILTELNLLKTKIGGITISAAACDDSTSWCLLALVISLIHAGSSMTALYVFLMGFGYLIFLIMVVRPALVVILRKSGALDGNGTPSQLVVCLVLCIVFISAFITDAIGIHAIFGGFITGIIIPHEGGFAFHLTEKLEDIVQIIFLPLYFALSGLRTSINSLTDATSWGLVVLVVGCACFGKIVGATAAARLTKVGNWRESLAVGCLMNCKGLVELIVLNLGYDAKVISQRTFAIMVIMALTTTFLTVPLVNFIYPPHLHVKEEETKTPSSGKRRKGEISLLVCLNKVEHVPPMVNLINLFPNRAPAAAKGAAMNANHKGTDSNPGSSPPSRSLSLASLSAFAEASLHPMGRPSMAIITGAASKAKRTPTLHVTLLRLIELTERDSSVMLQTSRDALRRDPVTTMMQTLRKGVKSVVKVVTMSNFGETLASTGNDIGASYILLPWSGSGSMVEHKTVLFEERRRRMSIHTPTQHASFMQDALLKARGCSSILTLVERSEDSGHITAYKDIHVPFFGGKDDREVLQLVQLFATSSLDVNVNIVRFRGSGQDERVEDTVEDELIFQQGFAGSNNMTIQTYESAAPISQAIQYVSQLESTDLVIFGRRPNIEITDGGILLNNSDSERKSVLGDFGEAACLSSKRVSFLVVQAKEEEVVEENSRNGDVQMKPV